MTHASSDQLDQTVSHRRSSRVTHGPSPVPVAHAGILRLQSAAGNAAVAAMLRGPAPAQPKTAPERATSNASETGIDDRGAITAAAITAQRSDRAEAPPSDAGVPPTATGSPLDRLNAALSEPDPVGGLGNYPEAWRILNGFDMPGILATLTHLKTSRRLAGLAGATNRMAGVNAPRLLAALHAVQLVGGSVNPGLIADTATEMLTLPVDQRDAILRYIASHTAAGQQDLAMEGLDAILEGAAPGKPVPPEALRAAVGPVAPGPWAPPGAQPIPFYIGRSAHLAIAAEYRAAHLGQTVFTNVSEMGTILAALRLDPSVLGPDVAAKPDIANVSPGKQHLYEIKPSGSEDIGGAEAAWYASLFARAGYPMTLGMPGEPGTTGIVPAPDGYFMFYCLTPGVISYKYRRGQFDPVKARQPEEENSDIRLRLPPLSPQQQAIVVTTTGMTLLMLAIIILLLPVGA
jgi:hypothetical protein